KPRHTGGVEVARWRQVQFDFLRRERARPARATPSNASVAGSGTAAGTTDTSSRNNVSNGAEPENRSNVETEVTVTFCENSVYAKGGALNSDNRLVPPNIALNMSLFSSFASQKVTVYVLPGRVGIDCEIESGKPSLAIKNAASTPVCGSKKLTPK